MCMFQRFKPVALVAVGAVSMLSLGANASLTDISAAVSGTDAIAGITSVAAVIGGILTVRMGARKILGMIK